MPVFVESKNPNAVLQPSRQWVDALRAEIEYELKPLVDEARAACVTALKRGPNAEEKDKCERTVASLRNIAEDAFKHRMREEVDKRLALLEHNVTGTQELLPQIVVRQQQWILEQSKKDANDEGREQLTTETPTPNSGGEQWVAAKQPASAPTPVPAPAESTPRRVWKGKGKAVNIEDNSDKTENDSDKTDGEDVRDNANPMQLLPTLHRQMPAPTGHQRRVHFAMPFPVDWNEGLERPSDSGLPSLSAMAGPSGVVRTPSPRGDSPITALLKKAACDASAAPTSPTAAQSQAKPDNVGLPTPSAVVQSPASQTAGRVIDSTVPDSPKEKRHSSMELSNDPAVGFVPLRNAEILVPHSRDLHILAALEEARQVLESAKAREESARRMLDAADLKKKDIEAKEGDLAIREVMLRGREAKVRRREQELDEMEKAAAQKLKDANQTTSAGMRMEAEVKRREQEVLAREENMQRKAEDLRQREAALARKTQNVQLNRATSTPPRPPQPNGSSSTARYTPSPSTRTSAGWSAGPGASQELDTRKAMEKANRQLAERLQRDMLEEQRRQYSQLARQQVTRNTRGIYLQEVGH
ncbi:hypothetical protein FA95DRAFT_1594194 [Auriscalpium vulgare]|uniref:Uncharacterized protein n=1 Tax=Auriscalpium vulgare TaxID=40419 RepID=A0ACB8S141_9AGAM|nr:hypothetical protein FA95DRAFT_1594194 [Auriscalpium vulgare]